VLEPAYITHLKVAAVPIVIVIGNTWMCAPLSVLNGLIDIFMYIYTLYKNKIHAELNLLILSHVTVTGADAPCPLNVIAVGAQLALFAALNQTELDR